MKNVSICKTINQDVEQLNKKGVVIYTRAVAESKARQIKKEFNIIVEVVNEYEIRFNKNQLTIFDSGA